MPQNRTIGNFFNTNNIPLIIFLLVTISAFISLFMVQYSHDDAGFYFKHAQEVASGANGLLYRDIELNYSPLPIYLYSLVFNISKDLPVNGMFLLVNYLFILGTSFFMYKIFKIINAKNSLSFIALSIYIVSIIGMSISSTEHFVVFFEVLMLYLLLTENRVSFVIAGISAFLAFYSKQYGLISIAVGGLYFLINKSKIYKLPYFLIGLIIPNIVLFFFYNSVEGFSIFDLYENLLFPQKNESVLTGENYGVMIFIKGVIQFFMIIPYLFLSVYFYFSKRLYTNKTTNYFLIFGLASFAPLLIASYLHYYLLILPFVVLFSVSIFKEYDFKNRSLNKILGILVAITIICSIGAFYRIKNIDGKYIPTRTIRQNPNAVILNDCVSLNKIIPRGSKVFIVDAVFYYYPADFYSIDLKNLGYTWAQQYSNVDDILKYLNKDEYILTNAKSRFKSYVNFAEQNAMHNPEFEVTKWTGNYHYLKTQEIIYYILRKK